MVDAGMRAAVRRVEDVMRTPGSPCCGPERRARRPEVPDDAHWTISPTREHAGRDRHGSSGTRGAHGEDEVGSTQLLPYGTGRTARAVSEMCWSGGTDDAHQVTGPGRGAADGEVPAATGLRRLQPDRRRQ